MIPKSKFKFLIVLVINLTIATGYYFENLNATYSQLSSDLLNIIPIAQKFDNPELYKYDLYVDTIENVKYYTPFYVQTLRFFAKYSNHDYILALNIMSTCCHFVFGILWFLLFYKFGKNYWIALLMSILIRGVIWMPGFEILGISGLWSIMPRTLYISLFPLPFLILSKRFNSIILASFLIGLLFNFHPITGLGSILLFLFFYKAYFVNEKYFTLKKCAIILLSLVLGMLPFIFTYFGKTSVATIYNLSLYEQAFNARIPQFFSNPIELFKLWFKSNTILFLAPVIIYFVTARTNKNDFKKAKIIIFITLLLFILPLLSVYVENIINKIFDKNLRMSFQLVRAQKMVIIPSYFALVFLLIQFGKSNNFKKIIPVICCVFLTVLIFSKSTISQNIPIVNKSFFKGILPFNLSVSKPSNAGNKTKDAMAKYIKNYTDIDAVVFGDYFYRSAAKRSVVLDTKGASMIIEGNPEKLIKWYQGKLEFWAIKSIDERMIFLKNYGVNYYVTKNTTYSLEVVYKVDDLILYKL
jgi:hypothetical protein